MTLTISIPPDAESKLRDRANAVGQIMSEYVEQLVAREIAVPSSSEQTDERSGAIANSLDEQYEQGYRTIPEDVTDIVALMPYLVADSAEWE